MMNPTYQSILNLLIAYEQQLTLSKDEFDAVDYYQRAGYRIWVSHSFVKDWNMPEIPADALEVTEQETQDGIRRLYALVKDGE